MRFRHYDTLRIFSIAAQHGSFAAAADDLNLTKGAVSYQMRRLEEDLGFVVFRRLPRGVALTSKGRELWQTAQTAFEGVEKKIAELRGAGGKRVTIGMSTYFASRWLSSRLMLFMTAHPGTRLRIQPLVNLIDLGGEDLDLAIRWGRGDWTDMQVEPLFMCPAFATGSPAAAALIAESGLAEGMNRLTLLNDRKGSTAWADWHGVAGLDYHGQTETLIVPDPNVRVQAVADGQGVALNDALVAPEIGAGRLVRLSEHQLDDYGYHLVYKPGALAAPEVAAFADWLVGQRAPVFSDRRFG